jgi:hypothetical protein
MMLAPDGQTLMIFYYGWWPHRKVLTMYIDLILWSSQGRMGSLCGVLIRRIYQSYSTLRRVAQRTSEIPEVSRG